LGEDFNNISPRFKNIKLPIIRRGGFLNFLNSIYRTSKILKKNNFDIINVHTPSAAFLIRWATIANFKTKIIYTVHGFYFHEGMNYFKKIIHIFSEFLLSFKTSIFMFVSKEDYYFARKLLFFKNSSKLNLVQNKIQSDTFLFSSSKRETYRYRLNIDKNEILFGIVCRINEEKGVIEFLKAALELIKENRKSKFIIIGDLIEEENSDQFIDSFFELKKLLGNNLQTTGFVDDVDGYLSALDVFCLPSYREGHPVSFIEASVSGCKCIVSDIRGCREIAFEDKNSILVKPKNTSSLVIAMRRCLDLDYVECSKRMKHSLEMSKKFNIEEGISKHTSIINNFIITKS